MDSELLAALRTLGEFTVRLEAPAPGSVLGELLHRTLLDTLGVTVAGNQLPELRALIDAWAPPAGPARLLGVGRDTSIEIASHVNAVAAVSLELDEGNKYARGHPAAHVLAPALALAQARRVSGPEFAAAFLAGYEVASRFGRATRLRAGVHPHGNWGIAGGAAACARLLGLDAEGVARAIDTASGLPIASPWAAATSGHLVRNAWMGVAGMGALAAARLAAAAAPPLVGLARETLGGILGTFEPAELIAELGTRFDLANAYLKRHASCSYTHPAADALLQILAARPGLRPSQVERVRVETYPIAATLAGRRTETRLAAMFSIPYVVAAVLTEGHARPEAFDAAHRHDPEIQRLMALTEVAATEEFAARLPDQRGARVRVTLRDGSELVGEVPNPIGDAAYFPFGRAEVRQKLTPLLPPGWTIDAFEARVRALVSAPDVHEVIEELP